MADRGGAVREQLVARAVSQRADGGAAGGLELRDRVLGALRVCRRGRARAARVGVTRRVPRRSPAITAKRTPSRMQSIAAHGRLRRPALILVRGNFIEPETSTITISAAARRPPAGRRRVGPGRHGDQGVDVGGSERRGTRSGRSSAANSVMASPEVRDRRRDDVDDDHGDVVAPARGQRDRVSARCDLDAAGSTRRARPATSAAMRVRARARSSTGRRSTARAARPASGVKRRHCGSARRARRSPSQRVMACARSGRRATSAWLSCPLATCSCGPGVVDA